MIEDLCKYQTSLLVVLGTGHGFGRGRVSELNVELEKWVISEELMDFQNVDLKKANARRTQKPLKSTKPQLHASTIT